VGESSQDVAMDGHQGAMEIKVQPEFLLASRPVKNGAGAACSIPFARRQSDDLADGQPRPLAVHGHRQSDKPGPSPTRGDEHGPGPVSPGQGIIQASWNWPWSARKDLESMANRLRHRQPAATSLRRTPGSGHRRGGSSTGPACRPPAGFIAYSPAWRVANSNPPA